MRKRHHIIEPTEQALRAALPAPHRRLLEAAVAEADTARLELWAVGGAVRDVAAGRPPGEIDLAVGGTPGPDGAHEALARAVAERCGAALRIESRFPTAHLALPAPPHVDLRSAGEPARLDIAALRTERYRRPGALPSVTVGASIEADLARRDFTVNALALALTGPRRGELVDPFGGLADLRADTLRVLHPRSFRDDATRLWRGARFAARLGLRPDADTAALVEAAPAWLAPISARRLWAEFERTAAERRTLAVLRLLDRWGVLAALGAGDGGDALPAATERALRHRPGPHDPAVLLAALLAPLGGEARRAVLARLSSPREVRRVVDDAAALLATRSTALPDIEPLERTTAAGRLAARWLDAQRQSPLQRELRRWERTRPALDAMALRTLGVADGPALGELLRRLRRERYLGTLSGVAEARALVRGLAGPPAGQASLRAAPRPAHSGEDRP